MLKPFLALALVAAMYGLYWLGEASGAEDMLAFAQGEIAAKDAELSQAKAETRAWMTQATGPWEEGTIVWECLVNP